LDDGLASTAELHTDAIAGLHDTLVIAHYERTGEIRIGETALDAPSDAERARQERMKRER
jgi:hypothetical protein